MSKLHTQTGVFTHEYVISSSDFLIGGNVHLVIQACERFSKDLLIAIRNSGTWLDRRACVIEELV